jgi:hypothetical protein
MLWMKEKVLNICPFFGPKWSPDWYQYSGGVHARKNHQILNLNCNE